MEIQKYKEQLIAFDFDNGKVNATDLAKGFGKRPIDFLRTTEAEKFIKALESDVSETHFTYETSKGNFSDGRSQGTWMGELLALRFAAWLSPELELFIYKSFRNKLRTKLKYQQAQLDYFWDKSDQDDIYGR